MRFSTPNDMDTTNVNAALVETINKLQDEVTTLREKVAELRGQRDAVEATAERLLEELNQMGLLRNVADSTIIDREATPEVPEGLPKELFPPIERFGSDIAWHLRKPW